MKLILLFLLLLAICEFLFVIFLAVYEYRLLKEKRKLVLKNEEMQKQLSLFTRLEEEKRKKKNAYMREYRKKKKSG